MRVSTAPPRSPAVLLTVAFFGLSGALELGLTFADWARPGLAELWEALGRAALHWLLAVGLWGGLAVCRTLALVYSLAALVTYGSALALAWVGAPFRFPPSVVVMSLLQVPSCALLLPWLRSPGAARAFPRPFLPR